jgi:hypothetical protein
MKNDLLTSPYHYKNKTCKPIVLCQLHKTHVKQLASDGQCVLGVLPYIIFVYFNYVLMLFKSKIATCLKGIQYTWCQTVCILIMYTGAKKLLLVQQHIPYVKLHTHFLLKMGMLSSYSL